MEHAGQSKKVEILVGPASESLANLKADPPYDLVFIDADKVSTLTYFLEAKRLLRKGGVVVSQLTPSRLPLPFPSFVSITHCSFAQFFGHVIDTT